MVAVFAIFATLGMLDFKTGRRPRRPSSRLDVVRAVLLPAT